MIIGQFYLQVKQTFVWNGRGDPAFSMGMD